ncbi:MAG: MoxR-like ATPase [Myxococcota bacterium]|jgi:MoxR-like ATPase
MTTDSAALTQASEDLERLKAEIRKAYIGQEALVDGVVLGLLARGNLLLEGAPGLGKTLLVRVLAETLQLNFSRVQFTPDLMPADITGGPTLLKNAAGETEIRFRPGPIFAHVVLADEINRGTPKTQSAMLEAMQEHAVTIAGERRVLEEPFFVIATQNPIEHEGTYPLPEAQLDRFLFKLLVTLPPLAILARIGLETTGNTSVKPEAVLSRERLLQLQALTREIVVSEHVAELAAKLTLATHPDSEYCPASLKPWVRFGASPRATQGLILAGRAHALMAGRAWVEAADLLAVARPILRHRIFPTFEAELEGITTEKLVDDLLAGFSK